jgi:predicted enzyme related to lactoylglutathione lyase
MTHAVVHFEIECEDVERARRFYEGVFGWKIRPWGPPNYYLIDSPTPGLNGDLRERQNRGQGNCGFVCTIDCGDLKATMGAVVAHGGAIAAPEYRIDGVGNLAYVTDTEGNRIGLMQQDKR